ncbi:unnamed protein product [Bursaphelenchus okinawaensis]|uniref:Uncharacterized protein n=1 Tax=Bursaphelenchus okinawaensis TaxID=465554 RepID=A0A811KE65_9BILA|nr:unnamed protein product [Bursaphelenchus okinawaensis]CAG9103028.1 unnamed protein product [Bursaphelenchus okinawaensis]
MPLAKLDLDELICKILNVVSSGCSLTKVVRETEIIQLCMPVFGRYEVIWPSWLSAYYQLIVSGRLRGPRATKHRNNQSILLLQTQVP